MKLRISRDAASPWSGWYLMVPPSMSEMDWTCGASLSAHAYHKLFGTGRRKGVRRNLRKSKPRTRLSPSGTKRVPLRPLALVKKGRKDSLMRRNLARRSMERSASLATIRA